MLAAHAKKHIFVGDLDFQMDLVAKSQPSTLQTLWNKKFNSKRPLLFSANTISSLPWGKTSCQPVTVNTVLYLTMKAPQKSQISIANATIQRNYFFYYDILKRAILRRWGN